mgnify:CR=1 FL=1
MKRPEQQLQIACVRLAAVIVPHVVLWATPNGGYRTKAEAGILKAMGAVQGVPDLCCVLPQGGIGFLELKAPKGKLSPAQIQFRERVEDWGALWAEIRTIEDFERTLRAWFPRERFLGTILKGQP